jgi:dihydrofolate reductase
MDDSTQATTTRSKLMTRHPHHDDRDDRTTRSIVETTLISLDGHVADPMRFAMPYFDADAQADALELLQAHDAMVFGRRTFEALGAAWAGQPGAFAERINAIPKYVVSSTLTQATWSNSHILTGDPVSELTTLKEHHERGLVTYGHGQLSRTLLASGLIDEVRFNLHPVLIGGTATPLQEQTSALTLTDVRARESGVVVLTYRTNA